MNNKRNPKVNSHKKDDDKDDEEAKGYIEKNMSSENNQKIDTLAQSVSAMRNTAGRIGTHLNEEKKLNESLEGGFEKTKEMVGNVMG